MPRGTGWEAMAMSPMLGALRATGPAEDRRAALALYGWLVGSWEVAVEDHSPDGAVRHSRGEWLFDWVLDGRAIQDVFIVPPRGEAGSAGADRYGTTLRIPDPATGRWRIIWANPVRQAVDIMEGAWEGDEIVQHGRDADGTRYRWVFSDIAPDRFRWRAETLHPEGWRMTVTFHAARRPA
jgi:hypothetical protein